MFIAGIFSLFLKFVLEVLGASGAIWGSSQVLQLRKDPTDTLDSYWIEIAIAVGGLALLRFIIVYCADPEQYHKLRMAMRPVTSRSGAFLRSLDYPFAAIILSFKSFDEEHYSLLEDPKVNG